MLTNTPFGRFLRSGGNAVFTVNLSVLHRVRERKDSGFDISRYLQQFLQRMDDADAENRRFLAEQLGREPDFDAEPLKQQYFDDFEARLSALLNFDPIQARANPESMMQFDADAQTIAAWLLHSFVSTLNKDRQAASGVTHYIWRTADDSRVRTEHAERDDRVFSWDHHFADGHPGNAYNCRCYADPAIVDGLIILSGRQIASGLADRISDAQGRGLASAAQDALVSPVTATYGFFRFSYLGYRRLFGIETAEEAEELDTTRQAIFGYFDALVNLDRETAAQLAHEAVDYFDARHAELRLLDLEYRLGLTSEVTLLRAYEDVAYLDASVLLGGTAVSVGITRLGTDLARLRPAEVLRNLRAGRLRLDGLIDMRRSEMAAIVDLRYAELSAKGHGPQRHDGEVTRQMLIDRVTRNIDPMIHTDPDQALIVPHHSTRFASRIITRRDFVAAEAFVRRSPEYAQARDLSIEWLTDPIRDDTRHSVGNFQLDGIGGFSVRLPIAEVIGPDWSTRIEGVARLGSARNPQGTVNIDFTDGYIVARFQLNSNAIGSGRAGEPDLLTLFPEQE